ncbi:MAG: hypothetical protein QNJ90_02790 [Planctomycetota bacterium]|nr:hypothetical protein [Planctomycetota bacterium]
MPLRAKVLRRFVPIVLLLVPLAHAGEPREDAKERPDAFSEALAYLGITEQDLGYRPKAHWPRYPHSKTVPYVLPFFDDLLAHPLDTYMFTRSLGNAVETLLTPELLRAVPKDTKLGKETLYKLGVMLATERRIGGFRVFGMDTARLDHAVAEKQPLQSALVRVLTASEREGPKTPPDVSTIPLALHEPLARFVLQLWDARMWVEIGLRRLDAGQRKAVFLALPNLAATTPDGEKYFPIIDDVARLIDEHSLHHGCLKALQAVQNARRAIGAVKVPEGGWPEFEFRLETRWGEILIDASGTEIQQSKAPFLVVRLGAATSMEGPVGATSPERSLSVALLMGNEGTLGGPPYGRSVQEQPHGRAEMASGVLGCGIVYAAGEGKHTYRTGHWGLGAGLFGLGALIDEGGDDTYELASVGQGAAFFGAGLLLDAAGNDAYTLREGDGMGFGGPNGIGILADRSGNDRYYAEPDAKKAGRADYHSKDKIAVSNAMGVGSGRRGDISDGHVWAGGLGALIDVDGNDRYEAGNFSMGLGYWYGTGLMWDGGGDDVYRSVYFTQGSGAHFAIGALIDEGGNDRHELWETAGAALAFGWDVVNAFLIDRGDGNDYYEADRISVGVAEVRSNAFFLDEGGDDTYVVKPKGKFLGDVDDRASYKQPGRTADFPWRLGQVAVFLDLGGKDTYLGRPKEGEAKPRAQGADGTMWNVRRRDPTSRAGMNVAIGRDVPSGRLGFLDPWPRRQPQAK